MRSLSKALPTALSMVLALPALGAAAEASLDFDPAKAPRHGTLLRYVKSNRDGSQPWRLDVYVVSPTRIEVVKSKKGGADLVVVEADLDPASGHMAHAFQRNLTPATATATMSAAAVDGRMAVKVPGGQELLFPLGARPFHFYGFDFLAVGWLLPHLKNPGRAFEIDFVDTNRPSGQAGLPFLLAAARFEPAGEEVVRGVVCRKYKLGGPFFAGFEGWLWANRVTGRLERVESSLRTSTDWDKDFLLELQSAEVLDDFAWENLKAALRAELAPGG